MKFCEFNWLLSTLITGLQITMSYDVLNMQLVSFMHVLAEGATVA